MRTRTARLNLDEPSASDLDGVYALCSDPAVWSHFPSLRHTDPSTTEAMLKQWIGQWQRDGLGTWVVRESDGDSLIGYGGCSLRSDTFWNLGYRFGPSVQGRGFATETAYAAIELASATRPDLPIVAYLLEHNVASAKVAEKVGLVRVARGADVGNPDPTAIRLVYSDRPLSEAERRVVLST